jgi:hypothetical protein
MSVQEFAVLFGVSRQRGYQLVNENKKLIATLNPIRLDPDRVHRFAVARAGSGR